MGNDDLRSAEQRLLDTGTLVRFRILDTHTKVAPDRENLFVRVDLVLKDDEHDVEPEEIVEWGAFGFLFALAALSFHDARPRGMSELDFAADNTLTVADFMDALSFSHNGLSVQTDYLRGRSMKTEVTIRSDGTARLTTWGRGKSALHWLNRLQGKKRVQVVPTAPVTN
jgi:hypothetical protein